MVEWDAPRSDETRILDRVVISPGQMCAVVREGDGRPKLNVLKAPDPERLVDDVRMWHEIEKHIKEIEDGEILGYGLTDDDPAVCFMMERTAAAATGSSVAPDTLELI